MKIISILGTNASGKSTRVTKIVDSLGDIYEPILINNKEQGRIYPNGIAVIGKRTKSGKWASMDSFPFQSWAERMPFFKELSENPKVHTVIIEGFFNMIAKAGAPSEFHTIGYDIVEMYFFLYDTVEELLERVNERALEQGKEPKTIEWAVNSNSWRDNKERLGEGYKRYLDAIIDGDIIVKLPVNTDKYYFVDYLNLERVDKEIIYDNTKKVESKQPKQTKQQKSSVYDF